jgi:hypothetical protein
VLVGKRKEKARVLRLLANLPRLPAKLLKKGFKLIKKEASRLIPGDEKIEKMMRYMNRQWMKMDREELCVADKEITATSGLESLNARLNSMVTEPHPPFHQAIGQYTIDLNQHAFLDIKMTLAFVFRTIQRHRTGVFQPP